MNVKKSALAYMFALFLAVAATVVSPVVASAQGLGNMTGGDGLDSNKGGAPETEQNFYYRNKNAKEFAPTEWGGQDVVKDRESMGPGTVILGPQNSGPVYVWPITVPISTSVVPTMRDQAITKNMLQTFGYPLSDTQFQAIERYDHNIFMEQVSDPQRWMWMMTTMAGLQATSAANSTGNMASNQAESAIGYTKAYLTNFTAEAGNQWQVIRDQLFIPMAVLLLLPGAVIAQVRAIVAQGSPILGEQINPFEGIIRSIIAIFLIPGTFLVINYGIDVANSITYTIADEYRRVFGTDMYRDALCGQIRALAPNDPKKNLNAILPGEQTANDPGSDSTVWNTFERKNLTMRIKDPCAGIDEQVVEDEKARWDKQVARFMTNGANAALTQSWNIMCAFQMAFLYYLWCMGPIAAALWVWPVGKMRQALGNWCEGVIILCFWALFWNTTILLMACFRGVGDNGAIIFTALNTLANYCVQYAFDFAGLVSTGAREGVQKALQGAMSQAKAGASAQGGKHGAGSQHAGGAGGGGGGDASHGGQLAGGRPGAAGLPGGAGDHGGTLAMGGHGADPMGAAGAPGSHSPGSLALAGGEGMASRSLAGADGSPVGPTGLSLSGSGGGLGAGGVDGAGGAGSGAFMPPPPSAGMNVAGADGLLHHASDSSGVHNAQTALADGTAAAQSNGLGLRMDETGHLQMNTDAQQRLQQQLGGADPNQALANAAFLANKGDNSALNSFAEQAQKAGVLDQQTANALNAMTDNGATPFVGADGRLQFAGNDAMTLGQSGDMPLSGIPTSSSLALNDGPPSAIGPNGITPPLGPDGSPLGGTQLAGGPPPNANDGNPTPVTGLGSNFTDATIGTGTLQGGVQMASNDPNAGFQALANQQGAGGYDPTNSSAFTAGLPGGVLSDAASGGTGGLPPGTTSLGYGDPSGSGAMSGMPSASGAQAFGADPTGAGGANLAFQGNSPTGALGDLSGSLQGQNGMGPNYSPVDLNPSPATAMSGLQNLASQEGLGNNVSLRDMTTGQAISDLSKVPAGDTVQAFGQNGQAFAQYDGNTGTWNALGANGQATDVAMGSNGQWYANSSVPVTADGSGGFTAAGTNYAYDTSSSSFNVNGSSLPADSVSGDLLRSAYNNVPGAEATVQALSNPGVAQNLDAAMRGDSNAMAAVQQGLQGTGVSADNLYMAAHGNSLAAAQVMGQEASVNADYARSVAQSLGVSEGLVANAGSNPIAAAQILGAEANANPSMASSLTSGMPSASAELLREASSNPVAAAQLVGMEARVDSNYASAATQALQLPSNELTQQMASNPVLAAQAVGAEAMVNRDYAEAVGRMMNVPAETVMAAANSPSIAAQMVGAEAAANPAYASLVAQSAPGLSPSVISEAANSPLAATQLAAAEAVYNRSYASEIAGPAMGISSPEQFTAVAQSPTAAAQALSSELQSNPSYSNYVAQSMNLQPEVLQQAAHNPIAAAQVVAAEAQTHPGYGALASQAMQTSEAQMGYASQNTLAAAQMLAREASSYEGGVQQLASHFNLSPDVVQQAAYNPVAAAQMVAAEASQNASYMNAVASTTGLSADTISQAVSSQTAAAQLMSAEVARDPGYANQVAQSLNVSPQTVQDAVYGRDAASTIASAAYSMAPVQIDQSSASVAFNASSAPSGYTETSAATYNTGMTTAPAAYYESPAQTYVSGGGVSTPGYADGGSSSASYATGGSAVPNYVDGGSSGSVISGGSAPAPNYVDGGAPSASYGGSVGETRGIVSGDSAGSQIAYTGGSAAGSSPVYESPASGGSFVGGTTGACETPGYSGGAPISGGSAPVSGGDITYTSGGSAPASYTAGDVNYTSGITGAPTSSSYTAGDVNYATGAAPAPSSSSYTAGDVNYTSGAAPAPSQASYTGGDVTYNSNAAPPQANYTSGDVNYTAGNASASPISYTAGDAPVYSSNSSVPSAGFSGGTGDAPVQYSSGSAQASSAGYAADAPVQYSSGSAQASSAGYSGDAPVQYSSGSAQASSAGYSADAPVPYTTSGAASSGYSGDAPQYASNNTVAPSGSVPSDVQYTSGGSAPPTGYSGSDVQYTSGASTPPASGYSGSDVQYTSGASAPPASYASADGTTYATGAPQPGPSADTTQYASASGAGAPPTVYESQAPQAGSYTVGSMPTAPDGSTSYGTASGAPPAPPVYVADGSSMPPASQNTGSVSAPTPGFVADSSVPPQYTSAPAQSSDSSQVAYSSGSAAPIYSADAPPPPPVSYSSGAPAPGNYDAPQVAYSAPQPSYDQTPPPPPVNYADSGYSQQTYTQAPAPEATSYGAPPPGSSAAPPPEFGGSRVADAGTMSAGSTSIFQPTSGDYSGTSTGHSGGSIFGGGEHSVAHTPEAAPQHADQGPAVGVPITEQHPPSTVAQNQAQANYIPMQDHHSQPTGPGPGVTIPAILGGSRNVSRPSGMPPAQPKAPETHVADATPQGPKSAESPMNFTKGGGYKKYDKKKQREDLEQAGENAPWLNKGDDQA